MSNSLAPFFSPKAIAVIGASQKETKLGYGISRNIVRSGYSGELFFINPKGGELLGKKIYKSLQETKSNIDLGIIVIRADFVLESIKECNKFGINNIVIVTGGFSETGEKGKALELEIEKYIKDNEIRVIGPNCIGLYDSNLPLDVTFLPTETMKQGRIGLISHSGAICGAVLDWSQTQGFGLSRMISLGNQMDVNETDILETMISDESTKVVTMYLEGVSDGIKFMEIAGELSKKKPVIALKAGRSEGSKKAIESHTGALAGSNNAFEAAFRKTGVHSATTLEEMFIWAEAFEKCPLPQGKKVAILTNAGGPGVTATDAIEEEGLELASFLKGTKNKLKELLPESASINNPIDMLASASPKDYAKSLQILLEDDNTDSVIVIIPPPPMFRSEDVVLEMVNHIKSSEKPVLLVLMGSELALKASNLARENGITEFKFPEQAASALSKLDKRSVFLSKESKNVNAFKDVNREAKEIISNPSNLNSVSYLTDPAVFEILDNYEASIAKVYLASNLKDTVRIAIPLLPIALKVFSKKITHKTDIGGVILNIQEEKNLIEGFENIKKSVKNTEDFNGVLIQQMAKKGQEVILGAVRDPDFGIMLMFGSGGTEVEGLNDVVFAISPLDTDDIEQMIDSTWAGKKLKGYRNIAKCDIQSVKDSLKIVEQIMIDNPRIVDIEFNPMIVYPEGDGVLIVDARIRLKD